nr:hypothetical protein 14 [bacterium]
MISYKIYRLYSTEDPRSYIGATINYEQRIKSHFTSSNKTSSRVLIDSYPRSTFRSEVLETIHGNVGEREDYWMDYFQSRGGIVNKTRSCYFDDKPKLPSNPPDYIKGTLLDLDWEPINVVIEEHSLVPDFLEGTIFDHNWEPGENLVSNEENDDETDDLVKIILESIDNKIGRYKTVYPEDNSVSILDPKWVPFIWY